MDMIGLGSGFSGNFMDWFGFDWIGLGKMTVTPFF